MPVHCLHKTEPAAILNSQQQPAAQLLLAGVLGQQQAAEARQGRRETVGRALLLLDNEPEPLQAKEGHAIASGSKVEEALFVLR